MRRSLVNHFDHWDSGDFPRAACLPSAEKPNYFISPSSYFCLITSTIDPHWAELAVCTPGRFIEPSGNEILFWNAIAADDHQRTNRRVFWRHQGAGTDREVTAWLPVNDPMMTPDEMSRELDRYHHEVTRLQAIVQKLQDELAILTEAKD